MYIENKYSNVIMKLRNSIILFTFVVLLPLFHTTAMAQNEQSEAVSRNDFKFTLLSLGSGSTRITYERAFSPLNSAEATIGIIGLGWDWMNHSHPRGLLMKLAYKWRIISQRISSSWLAGLYVKPEFVWAHFLYDTVRTEKCPEWTLQAALLAECGYQLVISWFVFDIYAGLGPSLGTGNRNNYYHSFMLFPAGSRLAFTAGFRLGVAF